MSYPVYDGEADYGSKFPKTSLAARVVTLASLVVSVAVLQTNDAKIDTGYVYDYDDYRSYKYLFYVTIIGIVYTLLQLPFAIHYLLRKKHLINSYRFLKFDFYADKIMAFLLATGAGASFGATSDLTKLNVQWPSSLQDFFNVAYIPAAFTLVGCIACGISSVHSSLALTKN